MSGQTRDAVTENAILAATHNRAAERLPPIVRALLDVQDDEIVVFGARSDTLYLNAAAQATLPPATTTPFTESRLFRAQLVARGGRVVPLRSGAKVLGEMIVVPGRRQVRTLAEQEREAIRQTLQQTGGRLAEAARRLGISRTTLWRRLKAERR